MDDRQKKLQELEARIDFLESENQRLAEQAQETAFLSSLLESISVGKQPNEVLANALEKISALKNIQFGAFCELIAPEILTFCSFSAVATAQFTVDCTDLTDELATALKDAPREYSGEECQTMGLALTLKGEPVLPSRVLLIPFKARLVPQGILILGTDDPQYKILEELALIEQLLNTIVSRLDNLSLLQELENVNLALNMEVDRRMAELHETHEELRKTMLQRLSAEDALLRQRDLTINIAETSPVGIVVTDKVGAITYANAPAENIFGLKKTLLAGIKYNAPDWQITDYIGNPFPESELPFAQILRTKQPVSNVRHAIEKPGGERILLRISAAPLFNDEFQFDGMVATIEDVTEYYETSTEFRRLQDFNASIIQSISEGIVVQDAEGYFTFVNPAVADLLGYSPEEFIGKHWKDVIAPIYYPVVQAADERRLQGKADRYEIELIKKTGDSLPVLVSGSPRIDTHSGEFLGSLAVFTDISEQKEAEKSQQTLRNLAVQLASISGIDNVLRLCVETALDNTAMIAGGIYLVDRYTGEMFLNYAQNLSSDFIEKTSFFPSDSPQAQLVGQGKPVYTFYGAGSPLSQEDYMNREELKAIAILPIHFEENVIACLIVSSRILEIIPESTKAMLEMISTQVGSAVARAQAEERLKKRADQLALLNGVGEKIAAVLDLESVINLTAQLVHASFGYQHVAVFMLNENKDAVVMRTLAGDFDDLFPPEHTIRLGQGVVGSCVLNKQTFLANNVNTNPDYVNFFPDRIRSQSELSVPVKVSGEVVGVIDVQSLQHNDFDETDVLMMETLADQVAIAIHNANLHESVQKELTERKRIEIALRESEKKFRNIVQSSPMGMHMYELEADGRLIFLDANPAADAILGVDNQQFIGKTIEDAFPALTQTEVPEKYRLAASAGLPWKTEQINYDENGISGAFEVYAFQTSPGRMVALFLDITERKRAEDGLRRSENTLSSIFRVAPTGIGLISERVILQVNQRVCDMVGYQREELIGKNARILYPSDDDYEYVGREKYRQIREFGTGTVETRWQHKDGHILDILMSSSPTDPDNLVAGVTFTALDITERKTAEARIQQQVRRLAALNQIDAAITGNLGLNRTIDILLEQTTHQLNIDAASILLYKAATQTLEYFSGYGFRTEKIKTANVKLGADFAGRAALERRMLRADDTENNFLTRYSFSDEGFRCYFGVPLIAKGQIKGVLEIFHRQLLEPGANWFSFLETLAGQAAIAIENAEMVDHLERSNMELRLAYNTTLEGWAKALELRDFETEGHSRRVTELTIQIARLVGIPEDDLIHVQRGALLHDIGKMAIPDHILLKNGRLDQDEWEIMKQHPVYAYEMLSNIEFLR
ncbi:MAG TPA: hypothetical protein DEH25_05145, partial [Chloroflexi bacterium]|nr:hypothetical protein [Chloroflexota bacterium]